MMLRALLVCVALIVHGCAAKPLQQQHGGEVAASHIVIVTPQAQVRLEPLPSAYLQHLSPFARYAAPSTAHEETIVYVPAGSVGPVVPVQVPVARSSAGASETNKVFAFDTGKQLGNISQLQDITQQIQQSAGQWGPQLSEAASTGAQAISSAGQNLFPALFPPASAATAAKFEYEAAAAAAAAQQPLIATEARHFYAIPSGVVPQVLDFVRGPVFVAPSSVPVSAGVVRARSIKEAAPLPAAAPLPLPLPLATPPLPASSSCSSADMQKLQEESKLKLLEEESKLKLLEEEAKLKLQLQEQQLQQQQLQQQQQQQQQLKESQPELKEALKAEPLELAPALAAPEPEKKADFGRLLEANALKEDEKKEAELPAKSELPLKSAAELKEEPQPQPQLQLQEQQPELSAATNKLLEPQALPLIAEPAAAALAAEPELPIGQLRSAGVVDGGVVGGGVVGDGIVGGVGVDGGVVGKGVVGVVPVQVVPVVEVPQAKVVAPV